MWGGGGGGGSEECGRERREGRGRSEEYGREGDRVPTSEDEILRCFFIACSFSFSNCNCGGREGGREGGRGMLIHSNAATRQLPGHPTLHYHTSPHTCHTMPYSLTHTHGPIDTLSAPRHNYTMATTYMYTHM